MNLTLSWFVTGRDRLAPTLAILLLITACGTAATEEDLSVRLVDPNASAQTRALFANLKSLSPNYLLFGHQDDLAYGVLWQREKGRSDVREVTGSYPAVYGWELHDMEWDSTQSHDGVNFENLKGWIKEGYSRGGVNTISWHMNNPASGGDSWDTTRAVHTILPGGSNHDMFKTWLDRFADFVGGLKTGPLAWLGIGEPVPIIFRPFHEHTGSWFWWGGRHVTPDEYRTLWRFTVEYLRDEKNLHNILYAYSTDRFDSEEQYLENYPGDEYVDLLGFDDYWSLRTEEGIPEFIRELRTVVTLAESRGKLAALTETGWDTLPYPSWWTERLLPAIESDSLGRRIAYLLVWRNANRETHGSDHFHAPYPGHESAADFVEFHRHPFTLFEDDLSDLYR